MPTPVPRSRYLKQFASRRREIVDMARAKGNAAAAAEFGISRERVRQIRNEEDAKQAARAAKVIADVKSKSGKAPAKRARKSA